MREIVLSKISLENFKSYKGPITVELSTNSGFKFVSGNNKSSRKLGANGAGKSSLWDALLWCFYGTSARGLRASDLVSWKAKQAQVEVELSINNNIVTINRKSNPNRLIVDGQPYAQQELDRLLGLSRTRFMHSVIFGQAVELFPDLSLPARASLLDDVLDLSLWNEASSTASGEMSALTMKRQEIESELARAQGMLAAITDDEINSLAKAASEWEDNQRIYKKERKAEYGKIRNEIYHIEEQIKDEAAKTSDAKEISEIREKLKLGQEYITQLDRSMQQHSDAIDAADKHIHFFKMKEVCPVCEQAISAKFRKQQIAKETELSERSNAELEIESNRQVQAKKHQVAMREILESSLSLKAQQSARLEGLLKEKKALESKLEDILADVERDREINPYARRVKRMKEQQQEAKETIQEYANLINKLSVRIERADYWRHTFRKVRLFSMNRVLRYLELETAAAMSALGLSGWNIAYFTETETKSGTSKFGVQIVVSSPESSAVWEAWSGGEGQRLRLAISLGLSTLIQKMSGVDYKFEVWDEPSSWLSQEGIEDLLEHLGNRASVYNKSLWLLDHRALVSSGFSEVWEVTKNRQGSKMLRIN